MKKIIERTRRRVRQRGHYYNYLVFIFIMTDFVFTYMGINDLKFITEGNPILVELFNLPFWIAFGIRMVNALIIYILSYVIYTSKHPWYFGYIYTALSINIFILFLHFRWMSIYLS